MRAFVLFAVAAAAGCVTPPRDFLEYWSAAKILAAGGNPYDDATLLKVQREVLGEPDLVQPVLLWTPPWTLPVYLPFGYLHLPLAHGLWLVVQIGAFWLSMEWLWRAHGRLPWLRGIAWILPVVFTPVIWNLNFGQNTAFLLLGLAGFIYFRSVDRPYLAGMFAALTAIKPHLLAAFGVVLILDATTRTGRKVLIAGVGMIMFGGLIAIAANPSIMSQFREALARPTTEQATSLADWHVPLLAHRLRFLIDRDRFWIQFVPCIVACAIAAVLYWRSRTVWQWTAELPRLVLISVLCAPYGGWVFDTTVLLVPLFAAVVVLKSVSHPLPKFIFAVGLLMISFLALPSMLIRSLEDSLWLPPAVATLDMVAKRMREPDR